MTRRLALERLGVAVTLGMTLLGYAVVLPWPGQGPDSPLLSHLFLAVADDGLSWEDAPELIAEDGAEPDVVVVGGEPRVFFRRGGGIVEARRVAGAWTQAPVSVAGLPPGELQSPDVVALPDSDLRMYVVFSPAEGGAQQVRSARSDGRSTWTAEPGVRLWASTILEPDVVSAGESGWWMYFGDGTGHLRLATSTDGLFFEVQPGTRVLGAGATATVRDDEGATTMWYIATGTHPAALRLARSSDGLDFATDPEATFDVQMDVIDRLRGIASASLARQGERWLLAFATPAGRGEEGTER